MKKNIFKKRAAVSALALGLGLLQGFTYIETGSDPNAAFSDISVYRNTADGNSVTIRTADGTEAAVEPGSLSASASYGASDINTSDVLSATGAAESAKASVDISYDGGPVDIVSGNLILSIGANVSTELGSGPEISAVIAGNGGSFQSVSIYSAIYEQGDGSEYIRVIVPAGTSSHFELGVGYGIAGSTSELAEDSEPEEPPASNPQTDPVQPEEDVEAENSNPEEIQIVDPLLEQVEEEAENASERALEVDYLPSYVGGVHDFQYSRMAIQEDAEE